MLCTTSPKSDTFNCSKNKRMDCGIHALNFFNATEALHVVFAAVPKKHPTESGRHDPRHDITRAR
jgi:hypothetical protein